MKGVIEYTTPDSPSGVDYVWTKVVPRSPLGQVITLDYDILLPVGFSAVTDWFVTLNGKGVGTPGWDGPSPLNLDCANGQWRLIVKGGGIPIGPAPGGTIPLVSSPSEIEVPLGPASVGNVDRFRVEIVLHETSGRFKVWRQNTLKAERAGVPTTYTGSKDREWWMGMYLNASRNTGTRTLRSNLSINGAPAELDPAYWGTGRATLIGPTWPETGPDTATLIDRALDELRQTTIGYVTWKDRVDHGYRGAPYNAANTFWGRALALLDDAKESIS